MKNQTILNITMLSSILLFSACSTSQDKIESPRENKNLSVYNILGITQLSKTNFSQYPDAITEAMPKPVEIIAPFQRVSPDVTYISYRKTPQYIPNYIPHYVPNEIPKNIEVIEEIESGAKSFLGVPYVWGATGPSKFDCSGFTQWVYRDVGINIPRVSRDQARVGQFVSFDNLQKGDMVFFDTKKKRTGRVTHVGIYLGDGDFIHASSAGKSVVVYNFNQKTFYKKRFLWGRRVLKPNFHYALN